MSLSARDCDGLPPEFILPFFRSKALRVAVARIPKTTWSKTSKELEDCVSPSSLDFQLKLRLWELLRRSTWRKPLKLKDVYLGLCSYTHFFNKILRDEIKLSWVLKPSIDFEPAWEIVQQDALLALGSAVEAIQLYRPEGSLDLKGAQVLIDAFKTISYLSDQRNISGRARRR